MIRVGNAPCSWGVLEFEDSTAGEQMPYGRMLDEMRESGYAGTELGDWGFMPTDPERLREELQRRELAMVGAFVPIALADVKSHAAGIENAVRVGRLLEQTAGSDALVVLSDDNATVPVREQNAGRIGHEHGMSEMQWATFAAGAERVARVVHEETGLRTVFHPHCGGFIETMAEIDELMARTDAGALGLCLDTGHIVYGGGDPLDVFRRHADRVWHVHFKDCHPDIASAARARGLGYLAAVRERVFCELGEGAVDFAAVIDALTARAYWGWIVVEQDVFPGLGTPAESARRNRDWLRRLGL